MGILQSVLSVFSRKKPEAVDGTPAESAVEPAPVVPSAPDSVIYLYSHGFTNGVYRIEPDKDSFERFLEGCSDLDRIRELRVLNEKAIVGMELRVNAAAAANRENSSILVEKEKLADKVSFFVAEMEQRRTKKEQETTGLFTQAKETISEYSWMPALLYFSVGITFIVADISITRQITLWGFDMASGWQSWIFAVGLALTAFLIKPMIDRLLEKPFQAAGYKLKTLYKCVLLLITALGLVMLVFLGKFRSDAEIAKNQLEVLRGKTEDTEPNSPEYKALSAEMDAIQQSLDKNPFGQYGLILSGVLFAIGSAVCLSISFGALKQLINRYWILPVRIRWVNKEIKLLDEKITALRAEHTLLMTEREKAERELRLNDATALKEELDKLLQERSVLLTGFYAAQYGKERALYLDGKNKGEKYKIEGELLYKVGGDNHSSINLGKQEDRSQGQSSAVVRPYTRRPFVKMRKMIADNFNKNQNSQAYDGTEFEIVS